MKKPSRRLSRRTFLAMGTGIAAGLALAPRFVLAQDATAAATPAATEAALPPAPAAGPIDLKTAGGMDALVAAPKKKGALNVVALSDYWADYKDIKGTFFSRYGLQISDLNPHGSSGD